MKLVDYLKETKAELQHVSWPTKQQALTFTAIVIVVSIVTAIFLGFFDKAFEVGLSYFFR